MGKTLPALLAGLLGLFLGWLLFRGKPVAPELITRIDSVLVAGPAVHDTIRVALTIGKALRDSAAHQVHRADSVSAVADSIGQVADSLARVALDTAAAYQARTAERDSLLHTVGDLRGAYRQAALAAAEYLTGLTAAEGRINVLEAALVDARTALGKARSRRCGLGGSAGYGAVVSGGQVHTGPGLMAGVACRL